MTRYTYRVEDPNDCDPWGLFKNVEWVSAIYILMKDGRDFRYALERDYARSWCAQMEAQQHCG